MLTVAHSSKCGDYKIIKKTVIDDQKLARLHVYLNRQRARTALFNILVILLMINDIFYSFSVTMLTMMRYTSVKKLDSASARFPLACFQTRNLHHICTAFLLSQTMCITWNNEKAFNFLVDLFMPVRVNGLFISSHITAKL